MNNKDGKFGNTSEQYLIRKAGMQSSCVNLGGILQVNIMLHNTLQALLIISLLNTCG